VARWFGGNVLANNRFIVKAIERKERGRVTCLSKSTLQFQKPQTRSRNLALIDVVSCAVLQSPERLSSACFHKLRLLGRNFGKRATPNAGHKSKRDVPVIVEIGGAALLALSL
jgi:hypothetical protein